MHTTPNILISWWALWTDFHQEGTQKGINEEGPTFEMHRYFYEEQGYDKHILLCTAKEMDTRFEHLCSALRKQFPRHEIEGRYLSIHDILDFYELKAKVEPVLFEQQKANWHFFFSPGTAAMSVVWFMLHQHSGLQSTLIQTVKGKNGLASEFRQFQLEREERLGSFLVKQNQVTASSPTEGFLMTQALEKVYQQASMVAQANRGNILIFGKTGTGKERLARYIHEQSPRSKQAFLTINCAAFGDNLLESRLFGHKKGAFTGAISDHQGYFEQADGGTLFLDEIGDISPYMQQLLLRAVQEGEIAPVGGQPRKVDVRIIAATHRDLVAACEAGTFRWDLYYRLAIVELELPSLQEQGESAITAMLDFMIKRKQQVFGRKRPILLHPQAREQLLDYHYPGNVRELENLIERFYLLHEEEIKVQHFPSRFFRSSGQVASWKIEEIEAAHIQKALIFFEYNLSATSRALGIALNTLKRKMKDYGIARR